MRSLCRVGMGLVEVIRLSFSETCHCKNTEKQQKNIYNEQKKRNISFCYLHFMPYSITKV